MIRSSLTQAISRPPPRADYDSRSLDTVYASGQAHRGPPHDMGTRSAFPHHTSARRKEECHRKSKQQNSGMIAGIGVIRYKEASMKRFLVRVLLTLALLAASAGGVSAASTTETFELHMEQPNIAQASNGDQITVTGDGMFSVHPKSVSASGAFAYTDSHGNVLGNGTWTATELLTYQSYGCGVVVSEGVTLPPNFCGGMLKLRVLLTAGSQQFPGILTVFCIVG